MPINSNIALSGQAPKFDNPLEVYGRVQELQGMQQRNRLADLMFAEKERESQQENALNALYRDAVGADGAIDRTKVLTGAAQGGLGAKIPSLQKGFADQDKALAELAAKNQETALKAIGAHRDMLPNVNDPESAAEWVKAGFADPHAGAILKRFTSIDKELASIPRDPAAFNAWKAQMALGATKFIEMNKPEIKATDTGGTIVTTAVSPLTGEVKDLRTVKKTMTPDGIAADRRAKQTMDQGKWQYDSERGGLVNMQSGEFKPATQGGVPIGPKDAKPSADYLKQAEAYQNMDDALTNYKTVLTKFDRYDAINPAKRTELSTAYQNSLLQAKEIYKLGVLNGGDERILKAIINNPLDLTSTLVPKEALLKQATDLQGVISRANQNLAKINKQKATPLNSQGDPTQAPPVAGIPSDWSVKEH